MLSTMESRKSSIKDFFLIKWTNLSAMCKCKIPEAGLCLRLTGVVEGRWPEMTSRYSRGQDQVK